MWVRYRAQTEYLPALSRSIHVLQVNDLKLPRVLLLHKTERPVNRPLTLLDPTKFLPLLPDILPIWLNTAS